MQTAETLLAIYGERIRRNQSKDRATGEPDDAKVSSPVRRGADGKGRSRLPVTADAYGLTNPGIRRNLASRLPYGTGPVRMPIEPARLRGLPFVRDGRKHVTNNLESQGTNG